MRDRVEEVVVARVDARVAHGAERAEHGRAAVLELARERARARGGGTDILTNEESNRPNPRTESETVETHRHSNKSRPLVFTLDFVVSESPRLDCRSP